MRRNIIVVVEDEPMNRLIAVDAFERAGFEVADFGRTDEALSFAERQADTIAILFTDIAVPGDQDGLDLALHFADRWPKTAILLTSGRYDGGGPDNLPASMDFIPKPWTPKTLLGRVADHLRESSRICETSN